MRSLDPITSYGTFTGAFVSVPLTAASMIAASHPSTPERIDPLRTAEFLGLPGFWDHAGNFVNGNFAALVVVYAGGWACNFVQKDGTRKRLVVGTTAASVGVSSGVNVAYEAGMPMPLFEAKPTEAPFDAQDALYGSAAGLLTTAAFCITSLVILAKEQRARQGHPSKI